MLRLQNNFGHTNGRNRRPESIVSILWSPTWRYIIENADTDIGSYAQKTLILLLAFMINLSGRQMTDACLLESVSFRSSEVPDMPPTLSAEVLPNGTGNMPLASGEPQGAMV